MTKRKRPLITLTLAAAVLLGAAAGHAEPAGAAPAEHAREVAISKPIEGLDWKRARLFPAAIVFAANQARREEAARHASLDELRPGADGAVDLALSTVIDLTLRNNLELLVRSYDPALAAEDLAAREAIYDPLLRFATSLFSSTNPTSATLAGAEVLSRKEQQWSADLSQYLPTGGSASVGFSNSRNRTNNSFATLNPAYDSSLTFAFSQPLLRDFGRRITQRDIRISSNNRQSSREAFRAAVMGKVNEAIDAYWTLYGVRETLAVQREGLSLAQDLLRINRTRVEVGTMAPLDVSTAEAEVARNEEQVIAAEFDVRNAEDRVRQLVNVPRASALWSAELRPVDPPVLEQHDPDVEAAIATAIANRPELRQQELFIRNEAIRLEYARNQAKPDLRLDASYGLAGLGGTRLVRNEDGEQTVIDTLPGGYSDALDQLISFDFRTWRIGVSLQIPIFNQLAVANRAAAFLRVRQETDNRDLLHQNVEIEVRRLARSVQTSRKRIEAAGATRALQDKRLDAEGKKFEHGLSTNFEVQQAQKDLTTARTSEVLAVAGYRRSLAALARATGTILESYGIQIEE